MFVRAGCQWQLRKVTFLTNSVYRRRQILPSTAWRLHSFVRLQYSKLALFNPPLLDLAVTVTFGLQLFVFVYDLPLEQGFSLCFSLEIAIGCPFFFLFVVHACATRANTYVLLPLPLATGGKRDPEPAATDNKRAVYFGMPARELLIKINADFLRWCLSSERNLTHNHFFYF